MLSLGNFKSLTKKTRAARLSFENEITRLISYSNPQRLYLPLEMPHSDLMSPVYL